MKWKTTEARNFCSPRFSSEERGRRVRVRIRVGVKVRIRVRIKVRVRIRVRVRVRDGVRDRASNVRGMVDVTYFCFYKMFVFCFYTR
jgi:hypothetical protein